MVSALETRRRVMMAQPHEAVASGAIASFRTDVVSALPMQFDLLPIQDLHGQANPYPAGGGTNRLDPDISTSNRYIVSQTGDETIPSATGGTWRISNYIPVTAGETLYFGEINATAMAAGTAFYDENKEYVSGFNATTLGQTSNLYTVPNGAKFMRHSFRIDTGYNVNWETTVFIVKSTDPHTWTPYSNICPITGHDGFTRNGAGINLLNPDFNLYSVKFAYRVNNHVVPEGATARMTITNKDTSIDVSGCYIGFIESSYSGIGPPTHFNWCISNGSINSNLSNKYQGVACCGVFLYPKTRETFDKLFSRYNIMVEFGSVAHAFEPYTGTSEETTFPTPPGTVYGGHVRDNGDGTGTLVVDRVQTIIDDESTFAFRSSTVCTFDLANDYLKNRNGGKMHLCNTLKPTIVAGIDSTTDGTITMLNNSGSTTSNKLCWKVSGIETKNDMIAWLANNPLQVVTNLATPQTYTLSLTALQSLIGQNHVWVDNADEVSVEYWGH